jgi:ankyrin repeat protein
LAAAFDTTTTTNSNNNALSDSMLYLLLADPLTGYESALLSEHLDSATMPPIMPFNDNGNGITGQQGHGVADAVGFGLSASLRSTASSTLSPSNSSDVVSEFNAPYSVAACFTPFSDTTDTSASPFSDYSSPSYSSAYTPLPLWGCATTVSNSYRNASLSDLDTSVAQPPLEVPHSISTSTSYACSNSTPTTTTTTTTSTTTSSTTATPTTLSKSVGQKRKHKEFANVSHATATAAATKRPTTKRRRKASTTKSNASTADAQSTTSAVDREHSYLCHVHSTLIKAARAGDLDWIKTCLSDATADQHNATRLQRLLGTMDSGCTALHYAVFYNHHAVVNYLLELGANTNIQNLSGLTPLNWAIEQRHWRLVGLLHRYDADPNVLGVDGFGMLHHLVAKSDTDSLDQLLAIFGTRLDLNLTASDAHQRITPLLLAASNGLPDVVSTLLAAGASVASVPAVSQCNTPFHKAAAKNHHVVLERLLTYTVATYCTAQARQLIDSTDSLGRSALHYAAFFGQLECVKLLVAAGASLLLRDTRRVTPCDLAQRRSPVVHQYLSAVLGATPTSTV